MDKKKIPIGVGIAVIVIITITVGVFVWKYENSQINVQQPQGAVAIKKPATDQVSTTDQQDNNLQLQVSQGSSEKTNKYINKTFGFEFEYPKELVIAQDATDKIFGLSDKPDDIWAVNVSVYDNVDKLSLNEAFNKELSKYNKPGRKISTSDLMIGEMPAKEFSIKNYGDGGNTVAVTVYGKYVITIYGTDEVTYLNNVFQTILKSFKFNK